MTITERLKQHIEEIEERRIALFFNMQNTALKLNGRMYNYHILIATSSLFVLFIGYNSDSTKAVFFTQWSIFMALLAITISLIQYISVLDKISNKLYKNICDIYKGYDDEFYILKKFNIGEIDENLIKQFYTDKTKQMSRYECPIVQPHWLSWLSTSFLLTAITLLLFA